MFTSRGISTDAFIEDFYKTLTPGVIPRKQFIDWEKIRAKCRHYESAIEYFQNVSVSDAAALQKEIGDALLSADHPIQLIKGGFELLGHTNDYYVSDKDNINFEEVAAEIAGRSTKTAAKVAGLLVDLGLMNFLQGDDVQSAFLGVQVGLESNRRKSVGGAVFSQWIRELLESTCSLLGADYALVPEQRIPYKNSANGKTVDFAIVFRGKTRIGVEVNFYTTSGSKPSEIRRAYGQVNRELSQVGVELAWITDGAGYVKMRRSLREAFETHPNTYNYEMARRYIKEDILDFLS